MMRAIALAFLAVGTRATSGAYEAPGSAGSDSRGIQWELSSVVALPS